MAKTAYFWVDKSSNFGSGESAISYGGEMPSDFEKDERFESFKESGQVSTEKVASKRQLSELESLREENKVLKGDKGEESKLVADNKLLNEKVAELEKADTGFSQVELDAAKDESVQADLDKIKELEDELNEPKTSLDTDTARILELENQIKDDSSLSKLELIAETVKNLQDTDNKPEFQVAVKDIKEILKG